MLEATGGLTNFDIAVIIIVLLSSVLALIRGFLKELFSIIGWTAAAVATFYFAPLAIEKMGEMFQNSKVINIAAVALLFLTALTVISIINAMILDNLRVIRGGIIDRSMGLLFGLLRGFIIAAAIHFAVATLHGDGKGPGWLLDGETYKITVIGSDMLTELMEKFKEDGKFCCGAEKLLDTENIKSLPEDVQEKLDEEYNSREPLDNDSESEDEAPVEIIDREYNRTRGNTYYGDE